MNKAYTNTKKWKTKQEVEEEFSPDRVLMFFQYSIFSKNSFKIKLKMIFPMF